VSLGLTQSVETIPNNKRLDYVFINFDSLTVYFVDSDMVKEDTFHRPVVIDIKSMFSKSTYSLGHSYSKHADGNCKRLCHKLFNYDFSHVNSNTSVETVVSSPSAPVHYAMNRSVPHGSIRQTKYTSWFSASLRYYIRKNSFHKKEEKHWLFL